MPQFVTDSKLNSLDPHPQPCPSPNSVNGGGIYTGTLELSKPPPHKLVKSCHSTSNISPKFSPSSSSPRSYPSIRYSVFPLLLPSPSSLS